MNDKMVGFNPINAAISNYDPLRGNKFDHLPGEYDDMSAIYCNQNSLEVYLNSLRKEKLQPFETISSF